MSSEYLYLFSLKLDLITPRVQIRRYPLTHHHTHDNFVSLFPYI